MFLRKRGIKATMNMNATMTKPITVEDHQNSRMIADPLRLLDCCIESDGGCAVIVTAADRARQRLVGVGCDHHAVEPLDALTDAQLEAMEMVERLANDPAFHLSMDFAPGDIQLLNNGRILHAREAYEDDERVEHGGHPVVVSGRLLPELARVTDATYGLRAVLQRHPPVRVPFERDPAVWIDLDTPDTLDEARASGIPDASFAAYWSSDWSCSAGTLDVSPWGGASVELSAGQTAVCAIGHAFRRAAPPSAACARRGSCQPEHDAPTTPAALSFRNSRRRTASRRGMTESPRIASPGVSG